MKQTEFRKNLNQLLIVLSNRMNGVGQVTCSEVSQTEYFIEIQDMVNMKYDTFTVYELNGVVDWCYGRIMRKREMVIN